MNRIRTSDTVIVIAGKSKGQIGKVKKMAGDKLLVENVNLIKKHVKPNPQLEQKGGIVTQESMIHISNVALYNSQTKKKDRVGFRFIEKDGKPVKVRYFKSNQEQVDVL